MFKKMLFLSFLVGSAMVSAASRQNDSKVSVATQTLQAAVGSVDQVNTPELAQQELTAAAQKKEHTRRMRNADCLIAGTFASVAAMIAGDILKNRTLVGAGCVGLFTTFACFTEKFI